MTVATQLDELVALAASEPAAAGQPLDLGSVRVDPVWALRVPAAFALRKRVLPLCKLESGVRVACVQPIDPQTHKSLENYLKCDFTLVQATAQSLRAALARVYDNPSMAGADAGGETRSRTASDRKPSTDDAVSVCDELLQAAILRGASDIHLVPGVHTLVAQMRVDGQLEPYRELPAASHTAIISRLKVLAGLDIAEKRAAQDGRISTRFGASQRKLDIRVATLPTRYGERMTLRLLTPHDSQLSLTALGMSSRDLQVFTAAAQRPHGLVLLTGPTGSGKSTTLYVAIEQWLRTRGGNVITIEDPIEYEIQGASQVEVDSADKVNFSKALRSVLRHDPDVVMIGEIRDAETAAVAVKASLTGHLVFSTLHTNTAVGVITRLADLGVEPFLIAATLRLSVAQRLVRRLCQACRKPRPMSHSEALALRQPELTGRTVYDRGGCLLCAGKGFTGRIALFEMVESNADLANLIATGASEDALLEKARTGNLSSLFDDGLAKIFDGTTTVAEVTNAVTTW
jgi:type II secretory ATPase GspE/PulE/Tfp pilus assembly ATPase PilB-like protein